MRIKIFRWVMPAMLIGSVNASAQDFLVVNPEFRKVPSYEFNQEWHYLTSEIYLFNASKFQDVLDELYLQVPKKKRTEASLVPENILITAMIDGTALGKICYPVFSFNIDNAAGSFKAFASDNHEAIRIIDNLPLSSISGGKIDCHINVDLITRDKPNQVYDFVATQLGQISSFAATPLSAAKTLVGELGNLITARSTRKDYKFSSTIRLYEEQDFNKRVASVSVYSFVPSKVAQVGIDSSDVAKYLDSNDNPKLDRNRLAQLISSPDYPYMVIVNYKSKYVSDPVIGDETTSETVDARLAKVRKAYESGLLTAEIYSHELRLVEYLRAFVALKTSINSYSLNYKNRVTDDFGPQFLQIFDNCLAFRRMLASRIKESRTSAKKNVFDSQFLSTYQSMLTTANVYMDADNNLKNIKNIVSLMMDIGGDGRGYQYDRAQTEQMLATLHSVAFPADHKGYASVEDLNALISKLEAAQYRSAFQQKVSKLKSLSPSAEASAFCESFQNELNMSYCQTCRSQALPVINDYLQRLDDENMRLARKKLDKSISAAKDQIFNSLKREKVMQEHFQNDYGDNLPPDVEYIHEDFVKAQKIRENLQLVVKKDYSGQNSTQINLAADDIDYETQDLAKILEHICNKMPELCVPSAQKNEN